ncbi:MAG TPA: GNAT family N-acetyltransferase [Aggregatilineales bacterium]|nr:GNAT family N-acetyltransferase [Aggregatilineales bacterium]
MTERTPIRIRYGTEPDADLLATLGARTFSDTFARDNTPEDMRAYLDANFGVAKQAAELTDPKAVFLIAEAGKVAIGYAKLHTGEAPAGVTGKNVIEIVRLYVVQDWLGQGAGAALMRACLDEARRRGHDTIWLGVWEHNPRAIAFYRRWGFVEFGSHVFQLGSDVQRDFVMERPVVGA